MSLESAIEFLEKLRDDPEFYDSVLENSMNHFETAAAQSFDDICKDGLFNHTKRVERREQGGVPEAVRARRGTGFHIYCFPG